MSEDTRIQLTHDQLVNAFARSNAEDELGQLHEKAGRIALLEGLDIKTKGIDKIIEENFDELLDAAKKIPETPLVYPDQGI